MHNSLWILIVSTFAIAFMHALAPDHWLPFAAIGKAQNWSKSKLLLVTLVSGIGHVGISIVFSVVGLLLGFSLSKLRGIEGHRAEVALWLLIGFGIAYMIWGIKKAKNHHHHEIDEEKHKRKLVSAWAIFAIIVLGPCEPLIPLVFLGYNYGYAGVIAVSSVFSIVTIIMMLAQSLFAFAGIQWIKADIVERYSHAFAGLIIALTGAFVMIAGV